VLLLLLLVLVLVLVLLLDCSNFCDKINFGRECFFCLATAHSWT